MSRSLKSKAAAFFIGIVVGTLLVLFVATRESTTRDKFEAFQYPKGEFPAAFISCGENVCMVTSVGRSGLKFSVYRLPDSTEVYVAPEK